ncbi:MAG: C39 family peptidase [Candidatus Eisenbacteria bacterium]
MEPFAPRKWLSLVLALAFTTIAAGNPSAGNRETSPSPRGPVVPYVAQSPRLCGGACLAMVMRYWGEPGVTAASFDAALDAGEKGMSTKSLVRAARSRGYEAWPWHATPDQIQHHIAIGRPVILLIDAGASTLHYVVVTSWNSDGVTYHDPAIGPARNHSVRDFVHAWAASRRWAALILPRDSSSSGSADVIVFDPAGADSAADRPAADHLVTHDAATEPSSLPASGLAARGTARNASGIADGLAQDGPCDALVRRAVDLAVIGRRGVARALLEQAHGECPDEAAPLRELAGLAFLEQDWKEAETLAGEALARDPADSLSLRLLGGSRYLARDMDGALAAWNRLGEPRLDLVQVEGSHDVRYGPIANRVGLEHGRVLSGGSLGLARRRVAEIPALGRARVSFRPCDGGITQVDVVVSERPMIPRRTLDFLRLGTRAALRSEVSVPIASPTGNGELWTARGRWTEERPLVQLTLTTPSPRLTGVWRVEGAWERQAYAPGAGPDHVVRETRRRTSLTYSDWFTPSLRASLGGAVERWDDGERRFGIEPEIELRAARDRLSVTAGGAFYLSAGAETTGAVQVGRLLAQWGSRRSGHGAWTSRAGIEAASANAPYALWPGAGVGRARRGLLRAHPLLRDDIVTGPVFGRTVWNSGVERRIARWNGGLLSAEAALFLDAAGALDADAEFDARWQTDAGVELRLGEIGGTEPVRLDLAHGLRDGRWAVSLTWAAER